MPSTRLNFIGGFALSAAVALVFTAAIRAGMSATGLRGGIEDVASLLFLVTLPAGALAALCGRLAMRFGPEAAFTVTAVAWILLSFPYGVLLSRGLRRLYRSTVSNRRTLVSQPPLS